MLSKIRFSRELVSRALGISVLAAILFVVGCTSSGSKAQFAVTTASGQLATVVINSAYPQTTLAAANGTAPYMWAWSGNTPPGMSLSSAGVLSGTPTSFGTFNFTVTVTDSATPTPHTATANLSVVINPAVSSVTLNPTTVTGGTVSTGTVTLTGAAAAAASVTLASNSASATVPATVTVAAGATTGTFQVSTSAVASSTSATITATYGVAKTALLTVNPPAVQSVALAVSTVTGGASTTGTVTLTGSAATGGDTVTLVSDNAAAQVPASVSVPAGQTSAQFNVTTTAGSNATAHITATFNSSSLQATLTIVPAPAIASFTAAAGTITAGGSTTLTGVFSNGTGSVSNGVGAVISGTGVSVAPVATTTYTLTVTNAAGTSVTKQATITVAAAPVITSFTAAAATITAGTSTTLTGVFSNGSGSVDNSVGAVTSSTAVTVLPASTTTYTLTVTNTAGATATKQVTVTVVPAPAITSFVTSVAAITAGASTTLTGAFTNGTGSVNNGVGAMTSGTPVTVAPAATTTYTLTVTNAASTSVTMAVTVTVVPAPSITSFASLAATITAGKSTTLTGVFTGGTGSVNNSVGAVTSGTAVSVSPAVTTTYTLTVTNTATTPATTTATVTVTVVPAPSITSFTPGAATIVSGASTTLTAVFSGGIGSVNNSVGAVTSGTPVTILPTTTTTYTLTVTNAATTPATVTATALVTVQVPPAITSASSATFTVGSNGSFTVTTTGNPTSSLAKIAGALPTGVNFVDNGNGTATISGIPATGTAASYPITITASNTVSPSAVQTFTLNVVLVLAPSITSANSVAFTAGTSGTFTVTTTGSPTAVLNKTGSLPSGVNFADNGNGTVTISGSAAAVSSSSITITASNGTLPNATQTFTFNVVAAPSITSFTAAAPTITAGGSTTLTGVFTGGTGSVNNAVGAVTSGTAASVSPAVTTTYTLTVTNAATTPVSVTATATVTVVAAPVITSFTGTTTILSGNSTTITPTFSNGTGSISPTVGVATSGTGYSVSPTTTTTYTLTVTNAAGSKLTSTVTITVNVPPQITSANSATFTVGVSGSFTVTTSGTLPMTLTETGSLPSPITFVDNGNGTATISGTPTGASVSPITITANNTFGSNATQTFTLSVTAVSCSTNCTISGTISFPGTASGLPISGLAVALTGHSSAGTTTNSSGFYSFTGLTGGTYIVTVTPPLPGYTFSGSPATVVTSGSTMTQNFTETPVVTTYSISGSVSYTGAETGKTFNTIVRVFNGGCSNCGGSIAGTSITSVPSASGTAYTVRGLPPGNYSVGVEIDTQRTGVRNSSNPVGYSTPATITSSNLTGVDVAIGDQTPPLPGPPNAPNIFPSSGAALVVYNEVDDSNNVEVATSYVLSYGTDTNASNLGTVSHPAGDTQDVFVVPGLTNGAILYFKLAAANGTGTGLYSSVVGPIPINNTSGSNTVSGTVTFTGITPLGRLNVGLYSGKNGVYFVSYPSPTSGQAFSISGVPTGKYSLFAFLDQKGCNSICAGNVTNFVGPNGPTQINVSGPSSGNTIALTAFNSNVYVTTFHTSGNGNPDNYGISLGMNYGVELPISMTLYSAPNVGVPYDMNADAQNNTRPVLGSSFIPTAGDPYEFQVTYANGSTDIIPTTVSEVLNTFATNLSEVTSGVVSGVTLSRNVPEFTWAAPSSPPTFYTYEVEVYQDNQQIWFYKGVHDGNGLPSTTTSAAFNSDNKASQASLTTGTKYAFSVTVTDNKGNSATFVVSYTP